MWEPRKWGWETGVVGMGGEMEKAVCVWSLLGLLVRAAAFKIKLKL